MVTSWCADLYTTQECVDIEIVAGACPYKGVCLKMSLPGRNYWMEDWIIAGSSLGTTVTHSPRVPCDTDADEAV